MENKIKLYALTGFLGSGKTTLLKAIIDNLEGSKVGVIQNEFGKLGIDGEILRNDEIKMVEINKGSIFCSCLKLSFVQALADMTKMGIDYLFVESSGLADPSNMEEILAAVDVLAPNSYEFVGAICVVDALNFDEQIKDIETVERQLKHCNLAVISKTDLITAEKEAEIISAIRKVNPICPMEKAVNGNFNTKILDEDLMLYKWAESEECLNTVENKPKTLFIINDENIEKDKFLNFIEEMKKYSYRLKGFYLLDNVWYQVDVVGNKTDLKEILPHEKSELVIISKVGNNIIKPIFEIWEKIFGTKPNLKN